jgi:hypothetical protein
VPDGKHLNDPRHWRDRAEEARILAGQMSDDLSRQTMLRVAEDYERLAIRAAQRRDADSKPAD